MDLHLHIKLCLVFESTVWAFAFLKVLDSGILGLIVYMNRTASLSLLRTLSLILDCLKSDLTMISRILLTHVFLVVGCFDAMILHTSSCILLHMLQWSVSLAGSVQRPRLNTCKITVQTLFGFLFHS